MLEIHFWTPVEFGVIHSLRLLPGPLWPEVVVPFRVSSAWDNIWILNDNES